MLALLVMASDIYVFNPSGRVAVPADPQIALIAHRGMHRTFQRENLDNDTCTAGRIDAHGHELTENTLPSMQAAFAAGEEPAGTTPWRNLHRCQTASTAMSGPTRLNS